MEKRHTPDYDEIDFPNDKLVGYVEEFDVYIDPREGVRHPLTLVAAPDDAGSTTNFLCMGISGGNLEPFSGILGTHVRLTPHHMCLLYALCLEQGLLPKETSDET